MKVKDIKDLIKGVVDGENVCIEDVNGRIIQIVGFSERSDCGIALSTRQEFPESWFDKNDNEVRWIHGKRVVLNYEETEDQIEVDLGDFGYKEVTLKLHDGWATGEGVRMEYPKLADITDELIEKLDDLLGHRISDSGFIGFDDVVLELGTVAEYTPPMKHLDNDSHLICESIQEVTLVAWPMIYGEDNKFDLNSSEVLETFRLWGAEFESWWMAHTEEWRDAHDYTYEVENFAQKKAVEWIEQLKD